MALSFLFGAAVQYNDPDPLRWIAIYLAASAACALAALKWLRWWFAAAVAAVALVWTRTFIPGTLPNVRIPELFAAWEMASERIEQGREMYGLLIIGLYMAVLAFVQRRSSRT